MKAAYIERHGGPNVLKVGELPDPKVPEGHALVRIKAASLNHLDIWVRRGLPGLPVQFPHVLGCDASGIVESSKNFSVGEKVIVHPGLSCGECEPCLRGIESLCRSYKILGEHVSGLQCEYVAVPEQNLFKKPEDLSFEEAAAMPLVFTTAYQMVEQGQVRPGSVVLVHAAGSGVSSAAIQLAKLRGAEVIATAGVDEKLEKAKALGADHVLNYRKQDFVAESKRISKKGVDVVLDHVGAATWEGNIRAVTWGGRIVICGATTGKDGITDLAHLFYRQIHLIGSTMGSKRDFPKILEGFEEGKLKAVVGETFPLKDIGEAHKRLESRSIFGKIVLEV